MQIHMLLTLCSRHHHHQRQSLFDGGRLSIATDASQVVGSRYVCHTVVTYRRSQVSHNHPQSDFISRLALINTNRFAEILFLAPSPPQPPGHKWTSDRGWIDKNQSVPEENKKAVKLSPPSPHCPCCQFNDDEDAFYWDSLKGIHMGHAVFQLTANWVSLINSQTIYTKSSSRWVVVSKRFVI